MDLGIHLKPDDGLPIHIKGEGPHLQQPGHEAFRRLLEVGRCQSKCYSFTIFSSVTPFSSIACTSPGSVKVLFG